MKAEDQKFWKRDKVSDAIESAAKSAFEVDWPNDNWERLGDGYHQARYRQMASAAVEAYLLSTNTST